MDKVTPMYLVVVQNRIRHGYRRAGLALVEGENRLENVSESALLQLKADPRLAVISMEEMPAQSDQNSSKGLSQHSPDDGGKSNLDGGVVPANLTVEQLKAKLTELGVEFKSDALKAELVALLTAVLKPKEGE